jgi:hypothetical protein
MFPARQGSFSDSILRGAKYKDRIFVRLSFAAIIPLAAFWAKMNH